MCMLRHLGPHSISDHVHAPLPRIQRQSKGEHSCACSLVARMSCCICEFQKPQIRASSKMQPSESYFTIAAQTRGRHWPAVPSLTVRGVPSVGIICVLLD